MIKYINGDLLDTNRCLIAHCCNSQGAFGAGVAGQIARFIPEVRKRYLKEFVENGFLLGDIQVIKLENPYKNIDYVVNMITQKSFGRTGVHASLTAIEKSMEALLTFCYSYGIEGVAMSKIGSGYGGLNWSEVESTILPIIERHGVQVDVHWI